MEKTPFVRSFVSAISRRLNRCSIVHLRCDSSRSPMHRLLSSVLQSSADADQLYSGSLSDQGSFYAWTHDRCLPLIREITFENAEELTDEGLPFLLLFHHVDDHQSVSLFERQVSKQLRHETGSSFTSSLRFAPRTIDRFSNDQLFTCRRSEVRSSVETSRKDNGGSARARHR